MGRMRYFPAPTPAQVIAAANWAQLAVDIVIPAPGWGDVLSVPITIVAGSRIWIAADVFYFSTLGNWTALRLAVDGVPLTGVQRSPYSWCNVTMHELSGPLPAGLHTVTLQGAVETAGDWRCLAATLPSRSFAALGALEILT